MKIFVMFLVSLFSRAKEPPLGFDNRILNSFNEIRVFRRCNGMFFEVLISRISAIFEKTCIFFQFCDIYFHYSNFSRHRGHNTSLWVRL